MEQLEVDWDLYAIVRGSCQTSVASTDPEPSSLLLNKQSDDWLFSDDLDSSSDFFFSSTSALDEIFQFKPREDNNDAHLVQQPQEDQLSDLYRPIIHSSSSSHSSVSPLPLQPKLSNVSSCNLQPQSNSTIATSTPISKRRRKNQLKMVRQVPADGLISSDDTWSWRKYGQKPIKGSPYPRGYYRCSTLKGCPARKQVERNRTDSNMFIVTYTAEHSHPAPTQRNSLAGTTRRQNQNKVIGSAILPVAPNTNVSSNETQQRPSSLVEAEIMMMGMEGDVDGGGCGSSLEMEDDFFEGLESDREIQGVGVDGYWSPCSFHA